MLTPSAAMKLQALLSFLLLAITAAFAALNWKAFTTPADLSLGVTSVNVPLGVVMLALLVVVTGLFLLFVVVLQTSALLETRRHLEELRDYRDLADQAEASRFTELKMFLVGELNKQTNLTIDALNRTLARLDRLEGRLSDDCAGDESRSQQL